MLKVESSSNWFKPVSTIETFIFQIFPATGSVIGIPIKLEIPYIS